jgi:hypothetical protein
MALMLLPIGKFMALAFQGLGHSLVEAGRRQLKEEVVSLLTCFYSLNSQN